MSVVYPRSERAAQGLRSHLQGRPWFVDVEVDPKTGNLRVLRKAGAILQPDLDRLPKVWEGVPVELQELGSPGPKPPLGTAKQ